MFKLPHTSFYSTIILILCVLCCHPSHAQSVGTKIVCAKDRETIAMNLAVTLPHGYHAYSHETIDTGRPTVLELRVGDEERNAIFYPQGAATRDFYAPDHSVFVYEETFSIFITLPEDDRGKNYEGALSLLLCSEHNCLPVNLSLKGIVPRKPKPLEGEEWESQYRERTSESKSQPRPLFDTHEEKDPLPPPSSFSLSLTPEYADSSLEIKTLSKAILFGLLAGLLLNIMPCVLPVLTFKMSGLLLIGAKTESERIRLFRRHNLCFSAGIISFFTILALLLGFADYIWGQLFQNQTLVLIMLCFVFLMALSLLDVFSLPVIDLKIDDKTKNPYLNAYLTGLMTTFLATPCSGPLLGGVLGWAFTQPFLILMLIFWFIGIGMALPYLVFSLWPKAVLLLPKTGPWMNVVEHIAGFFLLGTALYLLSILPQEMYIQILATLLLLAIAVRIIGRYCGPGVSQLRRRVLGAISILVFSVSLYILFLPPEQPLRWHSFTQSLFTQNLGKKMLFLQFTADWCPNCKFMEKTVLTDKTMQALLEEHDFVMMKVDLTQADAAATYLLTALGSRSIPLTAIFPKGSNANAPIVLRDIYDTAWLKENFAKAIDRSQ
ncbi:MAG: thioredoxin family protein [Desulfovibrio sp.]|nr:thioredoxin family protein [Desulfovibrio sp.]